MIQSKLLLKYKEVQHFFFNKDDTINNKSFHDLADECIKMEQIHGKEIVKTDGENKYYKNADGAITGKKIYLGIKTADCLPIFLFDPDNNIIGAVHAGWKGILNGIISEVIGIMKDSGTIVEKIIIAIGPHIRQCCYRVPYERVQLFKQLTNNDNIFRINKNRWYLSLEYTVILELKKLGIKDKNIDNLQVCTYCDQRYSSHRRDGANYQKMWSIIGLK